MIIYRNEALLIKDDIERVFKKHKIKADLLIENELLKELYIIRNHETLFTIELNKVNKFSELYNIIYTLLS